MNEKGIFITGTDTGVGKTRVALMLLRALRAAGANAVGFKPFCCGSRDDAESLADACELPVNDVNPVWMRTPLAPLAAGLVENREIDVSLVREKFAHLCANYAPVIVEGCGGWLVPVTRDLTMADIAVEFALPVLVVAANRLGALNHTLLTARAVRAAHLQCAGVLLNQLIPPSPDDAAVLTNGAVLEALLSDDDIPLLGELTHGEDELPEDVSALAATAGFIQASI